MAAMLLETKEFLSILALADRESIQARSELLAYNILPLDHGGIQQAIMKFPEELVVHLKITTLCFGMMLYLGIL
ncbi:hypothetical protein ES288_D07G172200v1 [Gossypium darwinii]|uniref:Uncharacterized protein n=1 Tax=Gossypium darwinii TaxID=34276 RepID=A0A5D2BXD9_GOSDA|nr:hypothetical protein ES288_D07G172200v1 [Gossypium darwinii]